MELGNIYVYTVTISFGTVVGVLFGITESGVCWAFFECELEIVLLGCCRINILMLEVSHSENAGPRFFCQIYLV